MEERGLAQVHWVSLYGRQMGNGHEADGAKGTLAPGLRSLPVETSSGLRVSTALLSKGDFSTRKGLS